MHHICLSILSVGKVRLFGSRFNDEHNDDCVYHREPPQSRGDSGEALRVKQKQTKSPILHGAAGYGTPSRLVFQVHMQRTECRLIIAEEEDLKLLSPDLALPFFVS